MSYRCAIAGAAVALLLAVGCEPTPAAPTPTLPQAKPPSAPAAPMFFPLKEDSPAAEGGERGAASWHRKRADALFRVGRLRQSVEEYVEAFGADPADVTHLVGLATAYYQLGELDEAFLHVHHALSMDPDNTQAYAILYLVYEALGNDVAARRALEKHEQLKGTSL